LNTKLPESSEFSSKMSREIAQICMKLISKDCFDGNYIIDYLGDGLMSIYGKTP